MSLDLDPANTQIQFTLQDILHTVHGTFQLKRGSIRFDPDSGQVESQRYPEASFTPDRVDGKLASQGPSEIDVHGVFRIHGADHEVTLRFQVDRTGDRFTASTHFMIPYLEWGMKNPSNFLLKVDKTSTWT
jgi:polyisoprenoid-binding protein YceI